MSDWKAINKEPSVTAALVVLCQDYVLFDNEFMQNAKIKKNMGSAKFWIEMAQELYGNVSVYLQQNTDRDEGYDDCDDVGVSENDVLNFVLSPSNRFALNDIICETVENWLKHFSSKRFK